MPHCGPELSQRMLLARPKSVAAIVAQLAVAFHQPVALCGGLEMIDRFDKVDARGLAEHLADAAGELRMGVQPAAHRRAADGQFEHRFQRQAGPAGRAVQLPGETAELLAQRQGRGIDQVRAADLEDVLPLARLLGKRPAAIVQGRQQLLADAQGHGHVDRRGKNVVGALPHVHVVVRMNGLRVGEAVAAAEFDGPIGDHLVDVHVGRGAGAGLKDIHRKLVVEASVGHLAAGGNQRLDLPERDRVLSRTSQFTQIAIYDSGCPLYQAEGMNEFRRHAAAGDGEVFHGPLRLGAIVSRGGQAYLAHRIMLDAILVHGILSQVMFFQSLMIATPPDRKKRGKRQDA